MKKYILVAGMVALFFILGVVAVLYTGFDFECAVKGSRQGRDDCYNYKAQASLSPTMCWWIHTRDPDRDSCYNTIGAQQNDASLCAKIEKQLLKDICYSTIAVQLKQSALCETVVDLDMKLACVTNAGF